MATNYGTAGNDTKYGTSTGDTIYGYAPGGNATSPSGNDILYGWTKGSNASSPSGNDFICGGTGNDYLYGGTGDDLLDGGETGKDYLYGGTGADEFILGSYLGVVYYDIVGNNDYAVINDFSTKQDSIRLTGSITDYSLKNSPISVGSSAADTGIYYNNDEFIGIVADVSDLNLGESYFSYVYLQTPNSGLSFLA